MSTVLTQGNGAGEFIATEANGHRSREVRTLASGQVVVAGEVLGTITSGGKVASCNQDGSDGSETATDVSFGNYDATDGDMQITTLTRDCELVEDLLVFGSANDAGEIAELKADLAARGVIMRPALATE